MARLTDAQVLEISAKYGLRPAITTTGAHFATGGPVLHSIAYGDESTPEEFDEAVREVAERISQNRIV